MDNASFFHGGEFGLGNSKFIGIQAVGFGKNRGSGVCEKMVADLVVRWESCKTIRGEDVRKFEEKVGDTLWGRGRVARREKDAEEERKRCRGEEVRHTERKELLKTFWLATSKRRL